MLLVVAERCVIRLFANKFDAEERGSLISWNMYMNMYVYTCVCLLLFGCSTKIEVSIFPFIYFFVSICSRVCAADCSFMSLHYSILYSILPSNRQGGYTIERIRSLTVRFRCPAAIIMRSCSVAV